MIDELEKISRKHLHFTTLDTHNSSEDFQEVSVWGVKKALDEAYKLGYKNALIDGNMNSHIIKSV